MATHNKRYLLKLISEGEHVHQDFKYQISDAKKIARSISAFANNSGGRLLVGVKDNGNIAGVSSDEEMYMIQQAADMYCRPPQTLSYEIVNAEGRSVLIATIAEAEKKPVKAPDEKGSWKAYFRVADENVLASAMHVRIMKGETSADDDSAPMITYGENEQALLDYLNGHGGITLDGYAALAHISRFKAEESVVNLCEMGIIELQYHNGTCLITATDSE